MKFKKFMAISCICATLLSPAFYHINKIEISASTKETFDQPYKEDNHITTLRGSNNNYSFSIKDTALAARMMELLGKEKNLFSPNDIIENENYKVVTTETPEEGLSDPPATTPSAELEFLDLSYSGVKDITELGQFYWPETLKGIDLSENHLTNENLEKIANFLTFTQNTPDIDINNEEKLEINANIADTIKVINLNLNNIDLDKVSSSLTSNTKLLYGVQKFEEGVFNINESPTKYLLRNSDEEYLNMSIRVNSEYINYTKNGVVRLDSHGYGDYEVIISSLLKTPIKPITRQLKQSNFNMYIRDTFFIERKEIFNLSKKDDIVIEGLSEGFEFSTGNASTKDVGTNYVNVTFTTNTKSWTTPLLFNIKDTKKPTLNLKGGETVYLAVNGSKYVEYGCIGLDSGDDISLNIDTEGKVDITTPGTYYITYTLTDEYGNEAIPVKRKVIVQAYALRSVIIDSMNDTFETNSEIIITAGLPSGVDLKNYQSLSYTWYYNGQEFITTTGDTVTGKSTVTLLETEAKTIKVHTVLTATLKDGSTESYASQSITLHIEKYKDGIPTTTIIVIVIAVVLLAVVFIMVTIQKKKNGTHDKGKSNSTKKKTTSKKKDKKDNKKSSNSNYDSIQVIKDYNGGDDNDNPPSKMQM